MMEYTGSHYHNKHFVAIILPFFYRPLKCSKGLNISLNSVHLGVAN